MHFQKLRRMAALAAVVVVTTLASVVKADPPAVYATYRIGDWTVAPATTGQTVKGFLAFLDSDALQGANISVVWYQREGDGSWTTWGWASYDLTDAVLYVRSHFSDNLIFEEEPVLSVIACSTPAGLSPKQILNGLFFDDPAQSLVQGTDQPEALVTTLVDIGWEAAPVFSPLAVKDPVVCQTGQAPVDPVKALMDELTYQIETLLFSQTDLTLVCLPYPCPGCQTIYSGKVPDAGSTWVFNHRVLKSNNSYDCYYDRAAHSDWHETGQTYVFCNECVGSGTTATFIHATTTSAPGDPDCHPPA